jgi:ribosomal protein L37AE/L43A
MNWSSIKMKNYWLDRKRKRDINKKYLEEAIVCARCWEEQGIEVGHNDSIWYCRKVKKKLNKNGVPMQ